ncbi:ATPase [Adhaeribacter aerolatus]|uniref:ATPase n=2 Tax=Adhaeribacter aerolatus TaxID=670289 RepID=A0A512AX76_9BACT|nr:ATPase [Adhaeribacter aerolatus]
MQVVLHQLQEFKKKFYLNLLIKGLIFSGGLILTFFLLYNLLEYFFYFPYYVRAFLFFSFLGLCFYAFLRWIFAPLAAFINLRKLLTDEQAARQVGNYYPDIKDRLLNTIQLQAVSSNNDLIAASINQKSQQLAAYHFAESIRLTENRPLLKYVLLPMAIMLVIALIYPSLFLQGTDRIIHYQRHYAPAAPFTFEIQNKNLQAFQEEDYTLNVKLAGKTIPSEVTLMYNGREQKLTQQKDGTYSFTFQKLQRPVDFQLAGGGFFSEEYRLNVLARPNLTNFSIDVTYPAYLNKEAETIHNTGNVTVPEGSTLRWNFKATATEQLALNFDQPQQTLAAVQEKDLFRVSKRIMATQEYSINLRNKYSQNKEQMNFLISSVPDRHPDISVENFRDTTTYAYLVLGGSVSDDYGLTRLNLHYRVTNDNNQKNSGYRAVPLHFDRNQLSQTYYHQWNLNSLSLQPGDRLEYFVQVWDNDGVHGSKSSRTRLFDFKVPTRADLEREAASNAKSIQSQLSKSVEKSQQLRQELQKTDEKLKTKNNLNWQDKKQMENLLDKKKQLEQDIEAMKQLYEQLNKQQDRFDQKSPQLMEKAKQLQQLMNDLLDEETKKLYQELEKLLQQQQPNERELQRLLEKMNNKENNLEKELERTLELFKQLQFETKLDNTAKELEKLAKEQEDLAEKTEDKKANTKEDKQNQQKEDKQNESKQNEAKESKQDQKQSKEERQEELQKEQEQIKEQFEDIKKDVDELKELDKQMDQQHQMEETEPQEKQVDQELQNSQEQLQKEQNKKASQSQKNAAQKMQEMAKQMQQKMSSAEMEQAQQNLDHLRDILENLITLSFDQEELMKSFRGVSQSDPRFITLGQQQLKLKDDAKIIEDSLLSLAKKVFQIQSFVTREVGAMNDNISQSLGQIKERNIGKITGYQQLTMTSINNLALMLNDALKQMQQQMAMAMAQSGKGKGKQKGKPQPGNMGDMQDALNQKIQELQKGNKSGKALSEELAKLAAEQQALRNALRELEKQQQQDGKQDGDKPGSGGNMDNLRKMMEQTETDLVNKRLTEQTIMRQREILTRLLEAEKSARERDLDDKREAHTASEKTRTMPPSFEKYLKTKQKQTELLKTVSPALSPYYKQEVNEYFQKMGK